MTPIKLQCKVFWAFLLSSKHLGVPEDSKPPTFPSVGLHPHTWPMWGCDRVASLESVGEEEPNSREDQDEPKSEEEQRNSVPYSPRNNWKSSSRWIGPTLVSWWRPSKRGPPRVKGFNPPNLGLWWCPRPKVSQPHFGAKCENATHTPKSGKMESSGTPENSEDNLRAQISSPWRVFYINVKLLKRRCPKWPCIAHLDICSPSYGQKKGRKSNCQFDSRPLKVGNRPLPNVASRSATWRCKALNKSYNFGLELVPIRDWGEELWLSKVLRLQPRTVSGLQLGSPGKKSHLDVASVVRRREYYMGKGGGFPRVRAVMSQVVQVARGLSQHPRVFPNTN